MNPGRNPFDAKHVQIAVLLAALLLAAFFLVWLNENKAADNGASNESAETLPWPVLKPTSNQTRLPSPPPQEPSGYPSLLKGKINLYGEFWCNLASKAQTGGIAEGLRGKAGNMTAGIAFAAFDWMRENLNATTEHYGTVFVPSVVLDGGQANLESEAVFAVSLLKSLGGRAAFLLSADCKHAFAGVRVGDVKEYAVLRQSVSQGYSIANGSFYSVKDENGTVWMVFDPLFSQYPGGVFEQCRGATDILLGPEC